MGMSQGYGEVDQREALATLDAALDAGVTLLDTAMSYGAGANERLLAAVLAGRREEVVLATKFGIVRDGADVRVDARPEHVRGFWRRRCRGSASSTSICITCIVSTPTYRSPRRSA